MKLSLPLVLCLLLSSCGYHLVGQGKATVIPEEVSSATLLASSGTEADLLLPELKFLWQNNKFLPELRSEQTGEEHVTLRIEQVKIEFIPITPDKISVQVLNTGFTELFTFITCVYW